MKVLNVAAVNKATKKNAPLRKAVAEWIQIAQAAIWRNLMDVRQTFPHADGIGVRIKGVGQVIVTCFNIKGNEYRLLTTVNYQNSIIVILDLLTHAQYDKGLWKEQI